MLFTNHIILAIQSAGVTRGRNGFRKDKGGRKLAETEEDLLQHRTDGSNAFDSYVNKHIHIIITSSQVGPHKKSLSS